MLNPEIFNMECSMKYGLNCNVISKLFFRILEFATLQSVDFFVCSVLENTDAIIQSICSEDGPQDVIILGGDGTFKAVVEKILNCPGYKIRNIRFMFLPAGSGNDFSRSLYGNQAASAKILLSDLYNSEASQCDVLKLEYSEENGMPVTGYCLNVASAGSSVSVLMLIKKHEEFFSLLKGFKYLLAGAFCNIFGNVNRGFRFETNEGEFARKDCILAAAGNGSYFGGGMKVCPSGSLSSGLLHLVILSQVSKPSAFFKLAPLLRRGRHIQEMQDCDSLLTEWVNISGVDPGQVYFEADGEVVGLLPCKVSVLPKAIQVRTKMH